MTKLPLYFQYRIQHQPQPAYIELDCRGEGSLSADYSGEIGNAVPMYHWNGLSVRWPVPCESSGPSLTALFADAEFLACCQDIVDGFEEIWDGSNHVGRHTDEALVAIERAEAMIECQVETTEVWNANDWLFTSCTLRDHWDTQSIEEAVATLESTIENNQVVDGDLAEALVAQAKIDFDYSPEKLTRTHIDELLKQGKISQAESEDWVEDHAGEPATPRP